MYVYSIYRISNPVVNIDLAPTILDMAGIEIPEHMDGRSLLKLTKNSRYFNRYKLIFMP